MGMDRNIGKTCRRQAASQHVAVHTASRAVRRAGLRRDAEIRRLKARCRHLEEQLSHATRLTTLGELAVSLAHELNQPLFSILSNAQSGRRLLTYKGSDTTAELERILDEIEQDDRRATEFILHVRGFLKPESGRQAILNVNEVVQQSMGLLRPELNRKHVEAHVILEAALPDVLGHPIQFQQVIVNLVLNAIEAMEQTAPEERKVIVRTSEERNHWIGVTVQDFGPGISRRHLRHIFEPFFTTKSEGLGIGLALSRSVIQDFGGRLWAANSGERGAVFHVLLPPLRKETVQYAKE